MKDYAKARSDREQALQQKRALRRQKEQELTQLQARIENPEAAWVGSFIPSSDEKIRRLERMKNAREELRKEIDSVRYDEEMLLREQQAEFAEEQWEAMKAARDEQEKFARVQWDVTKATQVSTKRANWVAAVFVAVGAAAAAFSAYLLKTQPPPTCYPAKVETRVEVPPPAQAPNVTVTLDGALLPVRKTAEPGIRKAKPGK